MKRKLVKFEPEKSISDKPTITITKLKRLAFSSEMMKQFNLEEKRSADYLSDEDDPYFLALKFYDHTDYRSANKVIRTRSGSAHISAGEYISQNPVLNNISKFEHKKDRVFEVFKMEDDSEILYAVLRPDFEVTYDKCDFNFIDKDIKGIYRYVNSDREIIYIGQGKIYNQLKLAYREDWDVARVEFSIENDKSKCLKWEKYHLDKHKSQFHSLPKHNILNGQTTKPEKFDIANQISLEAKHVRF